MKLPISAVLGLGWGIMLGALGFCSALARSPGQYRVYIGTYTGSGSQGIYQVEFDAETGRLSVPELAAAMTHPTFLAVHPNHRFLYAVSEVDRFQGQPGGGVSAFAMDKATGRLTLLNQQSSGGAGPAHLALDRRGRCVLVANYGGGSVASLPIASDGRLEPPRPVIQHHGSSVDRQRQEGPHAHFILPDARNRFALVCDLGLDQVLAYPLAPTGAELLPGKPVAGTVTAGSGPRHLAVSPDGRRLYVLNEMAASVTLFDYSPRSGAMREVETASALPEDFNGPKSGAEIQLHPNGKFLYTSNRGHDSLAVFALDRRTGRMRLVQNQSTGGSMPRHFTLDPSGRWLLAENQGSNSINVFVVDASTGRLTPTGEHVTVPTPACAVLVPMPTP